MFKFDMFTRLNDLQGQFLNLEASHIQAQTFLGLRLNSLRQGFYFTEEWSFLISVYHETPTKVDQCLR